MSFEELVSGGEGQLPTEAVAAAKYGTCGKERGEEEERGRGGG